MYGRSSELGMFAQIGYPAASDTIVFCPGVTPVEVRVQRWPVIIPPPHSGILKARQTSKVHVTIERTIGVIVSCRGDRGFKDLRIFNRVISTSQAFLMLSITDIIHRS